MTAILIATLAGLLLGTAWAGAAGWYLLLTRSYRRVRNLIVIGLGYLLFPALCIGSLLLLFSFCDMVGINHRSSSGSAALYAFAISCASVMFFIVRAESRWRKSVGLDDKSLISPT